MRPKWMYSVPCGALLLGASVLLAQEPPPGRPPGPEDVAFATEAGGFVGGKMEILGFGEMHPGKVVTGAPYSAVAVTETRQTLSDGNCSNRAAKHGFRQSELFQSPAGVAEFSSFGKTIHASGSFRPWGDAAQQYAERPALSSDGRNARRSQHGADTYRGPRQLFSDGIAA